MILYYAMLYCIYFLDWYFIKQQKFEMKKLKRTKNTSLLFSLCKEKIQLRQIHKVIL